MVKCDDTYSFHLSADESIYSDTGSVSSSYKARIDSLFRDKRKQSALSSIPNHQAKTKVQVHTSESGSDSSGSSKRENGFASRHSELHRKNTSPSGGHPKISHVTSIRIPSPQAWKAKIPTPKEELENIFGGADQRQRAFNDTRIAVQAQIERLFADASSEQPSIPGVVRLLPQKPGAIPLPPDDLPPPLPPPPLPRNPPPLPKNPPPPLPGRSPTSSQTASSSSRSSPSSCLTPVEDTSSIRSSPTSQSSTCDLSGSRSCLTKKYYVDYLGAVQLSDRATTLDLLQEPLKDLYYKYRFHIFKGRKPVPGGIHITEKGFRIIHGSESTPGHYELLNPFPTIAVWAAVKLVIRKEVGEHGQMFLSYAFLPLICDPEAQDKYNMHHELNVPDPSVMAGDHPPMFACVMRKLGASKVLECHGFVCRSAEDAIVIAANLYQSLLENMQSGDSSDSSDSRTQGNEHGLKLSANVPVRPPRKKKDSRSMDSLDSRLKLRRSNSEDLLSSGRAFSSNRISKRKIKRSISDRQSLSALDDSDNYSKVTLPRSKSFVDVSSKYDFKELLKDVKTQTGLNSVDDVLKQIVNPKGMSFSEMDPKYRDVLLKVVLTMSKDEIYQKSKNIMKKYKCRTTSASSIADIDNDASTISSVLKATKRSFSRLGSRASSLHQPMMKTKTLESKKLAHVKEDYDNKLEKSLEYSFSKAYLDTDKVCNQQPKKIAPKTPMPKRMTKGSSDGYVSCSECGYESECSNKCYCSFSRIKPPIGRPSTNPPKTSSPKTTFAKIGMSPPCECDTESCAESDKCYCSLKSLNLNEDSVYDSSIDSGTNTDTDTTIKTKISVNRTLRSEGSSSSNSQRNFHSVSTEHSKSRSAGTVFNLHPDVIRSGSLSSPFSSDSDTSEGRMPPSRMSSRSRVSFLKKRSSSTEFLTDHSSRNQRRHPSGSIGSASSGDSHDSNEYSLTRRSSMDCLIDRGPRRSKTGSQRKVLLVSAVDPSGKVVYRGKSEKARNEGADTASILSMKKTAEIAALFSELKLNQTTDFLATSGRPPLRCSDGCSSESEDSCSVISLKANGSFLFSDRMEDTLGYLP